MIIQHFGNLISSFHKKYFDKLIATSSSINTGLAMARPTVRFETSVIKQKRGRIAKPSGTNKCNKKNWAFNFYLPFGFVFFKFKKIYISHVTLATFICLVLFFGFFSQSSYQAKRFFLPITSWLFFSVFWG